MIGDRLYIYDERSDVFFAGWLTYGYNVPQPYWTKAPDEAHKTLDLKWARSVADGLGVRVISETQARRIVGLREYRRRCGA